MGLFLVDKSGSGGASDETNESDQRVKTKKYHGQSFANLEYNYDAEGRLSWRRFWSSGTVNSWSRPSHYHADGNANVTYLVNSSQGEAASYRYDPKLEGVRRGQKRTPSR